MALASGFIGAQLVIQYFTAIKGLNRGTNNTAVD